MIKDIEKAKKTFNIMTEILSAFEYTYYTEINDIKESLEKQVIKKVLNGVCECGNIDLHGKYCSECGQRVDFEEDNSCKNCGLCTCLSCEERDKCRCDSVCRDRPIDSCSRKVEEQY